MANKSIDALLKGILKDSKAIARQAMEEAAKKAYEDIVNEANSCIEKYYANYKPKWYRRKRNLYKSITPIFKDNSSRKKISFTIGVQYDSEKLNGLYKSNSWYHQSGDEWRSWDVLFVGRRIRQMHKTGFNYDGQDNGVPEPDWILDNFLTGVHPSGTHPSGNHPWSRSKKDKEYTSDLMEKFIRNELPNRINGYVQQELFDIIVAKLQGR